MARDIHDTLAQGLTGIVTHVRAAGRAAGDPRRLGFHLDRVESLATDSLNEARRSVQALRPGPLTGSRLPSCLRRPWRRAQNALLRRATARSLHRSDSPGGSLRDRFLAGSKPASHAIAAVAVPEG
ncbi:histidine kinase dimerization/phosphoacceptor domain-containing protein [Actinomadura rugatobispora]|uniref:Histidine kinase dimerization/phosphoacceptor domain-containing protein n=1 Tax=Actinomadura rugatobispora TaxID=1994 RepID=A0ABW1AGF4_9ACTN